MKDTGWLTLLFAVVGALVALGQVRQARSQRKLEDASNQIAQYSAWRELDESWRWSTLAARGPSQGVFSGFDPEERDRFAAVIEAYRMAAVENYDSYLTDNDGMAAYQVAVANLTEAEALVAPYRNHAEAILGFLGRSAGLVFRGNISIDAAYNAYGPDLVTHRDVLRTLTAETPTASGHPGSFMPVFDSFRGKTGDYVSSKMGWATTFVELPGFLQRIRALVLLMVARSEIAGDLAINGPPGAPPVSTEEMAIALACTRTTSWPRAIRVAWNLYRARCVHRSKQMISAATLDDEFTGYMKARGYRIATAIWFPVALVGLMRSRSHIREGLWDDMKEEADPRVTP